MLSYSPSGSGEPLRVVICGGGASAVMLVAALKERVAQPICITIMEPRGQLGAGVAYSTRCAAHLLNTRAGNMPLWNYLSYVTWATSLFSRRCLLPRSHGVAAEVPQDFKAAFPTALAAIVKRVREASIDDPHGDRSRGVMTELRMMAPVLWSDWNLPERRRFLRHVRTFWDVHRHRLAPSVHAKLSRAMASGQLSLVRGREKGTTGGSGPGLPAEPGKHNHGALGGCGPASGTVPYVD